LSSVRATGRWGDGEKKETGDGEMRRKRRRGEREMGRN